MILVTGGTGMVGAHLLYFLLKQNQSAKEENRTVRAIHRKNSDVASVKNIFVLYSPEANLLFDKIEWVEADITDIPALTTAFEGVTQVYHCAALVNFNPAKYKLLKKINVDGTANIVNLCLAKNVRKLCYVSSVATFGSPAPGVWTDENCFWNPDEKNNVYAITKYGAEMEVWRGTQEGLDAVIVNPGIILGTSPHSAGSGIVVGLGSSGIPFYPSGGMGIVDVRDVVEAMILLMNSTVKNEQFIVVGKNVSYKELLTKLALLFNKKPPTKKLPKSIMYFLSGVDWISSKIFRTRRRIVKATVRSMFKTSYYDASKIKSKLEFSFTPMENTLERVAKTRMETLN